MGEAKAFFKDDESVGHCSGSFRQAVCIGVQDRQVIQTKGGGGMAIASSALQILSASTYSGSASP